MAPCAACPLRRDPWAKVTATITAAFARAVVRGRLPHRRRGRSAADRAQAEGAVSIHRRRLSANAGKPLPTATLDGSWDRRLRSGAVEPDRTLDLHGHSLDRAWQAIDRADRAVVNRETGSCC